MTAKAAKCLISEREIGRKKKSLLKPYPIMMNLHGKTVIVVGGGRVALRKIMALIPCGAKVTVISPRIERELERLVQEGELNWLKEEFRHELLSEFPDTFLIFGTTDIREVNVEVHRAAAQRNVPCNIADVPDLCTFIVPAVISQGDLMIAVSTGGSSPALARRIREDLEKRFGPEYATMTRLMGELRREIIKQGKPSDENKRLFMELVDSEILDALKQNDKEKIFEVLKAILPADVNTAPALKETQETLELR
ncbi:MAG: precorrin-2 dehydrogenase [Thermodesulfobacteriota bacterium]|nr:precorrin-2 dehydrogenase [Thermodesulfobacteriota bacterium]